MNLSRIFKGKNGAVSGLGILTGRYTGDTDVRGHKVISLVMASIIDKHLGGPFSMNLTV